MYPDNRALVYNTSFYNFLLKSANIKKGKSTFLLYLLIQRLATCQPTVYRVDDERCYYFDETHSGRCMNANQLFDLSPIAKHDLWILTEKGLTRPMWNQSWHTWFVVLASSEREVQHCRQWVKDRNPGEAYLNNMAWDEIYAAFM